MNKTLGWGICVVFAAIVLAGCATAPMAGKRELILVGNDQKVLWSDAGKPTLLAPGNDNVLVVDIGTDPLAPKIVANLPLMNTVFGPPTNLQITPDGKLGLVDQSMDWVADGATWKAVPDNKLYVIDLTLDPPKLIDTVTVGKQPSGMAINRAGDLALIANRNENSISVLKIAGKSVKLIDTVDHRRAGIARRHHRRWQARRGGEISRPQGCVARHQRRQGYLRQAGHRGWLVAVQPRHHAGRQTLAHRRQRFVGRLRRQHRHGYRHRSRSRAAARHRQGRRRRRLLKALPSVPTARWRWLSSSAATDAAKNAYFYNRNGSVVALKIDGKKVTRTNEVEVRGLPEGLAFSDDGKYLYVGNFIDSDITILQVVGDQLVDTGKRMALPGHPASVRARAR